MQSMGILAALLAINEECSSAQLKVEATDHVQRDLYHSPETPGYTSWVGLWQLPNGNLRLDFTQLTGPKEKPISTVPVLESRNGGGTWTRVNPDAATEVLLPKSAYQCGKESCRGAVVFPDGTMVRPVWPPDDVKTSGSVQRSTDGGKTWSDKIFFLPVEEYRTWPTNIRALRDGRLVLVAGCWKRGDAQNVGGDPAWQNMAKMIFISTDNGKTWGKPIPVMPIAVGTCEESDFCELPNGDLFFVHRVEVFPDHMTEEASSPLAAVMGPTPPQSYWYSARMQSIVRKQGETFVPGKCEPASLPHSGYPAVLYTKEGIILHLATDGVSWTTDLGKTWKRLNVPGTPYYPKALQLKDSTILVVGHAGSDDAYGSVDQRIIQQTFKLRITKSDDVEASGFPGGIETFDNYKAGAALPGSWFNADGKMMVTADGQSGNGVHSGAAAGESTTAMVATGTADLVSASCQIYTTRGDSYRETVFGLFADDFVAGENNLANTQGLFFESVRRPGGASQLCFAKGNMFTAQYVGVAHSVDIARETWYDLRIITDGTDWLYQYKPVADADWITGATLPVNNVPGGFAPNYVGITFYKGDGIVDNVSIVSDKKTK